MGEATSKQTMKTEATDSEKYFNNLFLEGFNALATAAHYNARSKGFWDKSDALQSLADAHGLGRELRKMRDAQLNALISSEIGEALEGSRKDLASEKIPGFTNEEEEYADAIIRILDLTCGRKLRIGEAVIAKMEHNAGREAMHGGKHF